MDPQRPLGFFWEAERRGGDLAPVLTVLLAGAECRFTCVFCDLWRQTLDGPTPPGAIPTQIARALEGAGPVPPDAGIKLYNASNFFDERAVPAGDDPAIAALLDRFKRVTVECHPRLVGKRCRAFAEQLGERGGAGRLEVAMGLETIHPEALARLNKRMRLVDFDRAAELLADAGIGLRVFLLVPPPFVPPAETADWIGRSVKHAERAGAAHITLIPTRLGNGALEELAPMAAFTRPTLLFVEEVYQAALGETRATVTVDLWDSERLGGCDRCRLERIARLRRINATGRLEPRVECGACGSRS